MNNAHLAVMEQSMLLLAVIFSATFCGGHDLATCKYVTIPVCGQDAVATDLLQGDTNPRVAVGPPGKAGARGPPGPKGSRGEIGEKGGQGEQVDLGLVAQMINKQLADFERKAMSKTATDLCKQVNESGVYRFYGEIFLCDGKGWTVIQHRRDGSVNFERSWADYSHGFGSLDGEFWTGLTTLHKLTRDRDCQIRFDMASFEGETAYAEYSSFSIADEGRKFRISISGYSGTAGDSMTFHDGSVFSTKDQDNDEHSSNCALDRGGWWYKNCYRASPNAVWGRSTGRWTRILWYTWKRESEALDSTTIKLRCT